MNEVSMILYGIGVLGSLDKIVGVIFGLGIMALAISLPFYIIVKLDKHNDGEIKAFHSAYKWAVPLVFFCGSFSVLIPNSQTMYAIAASEITEETIQSDVGRAVLDKLTEELGLEIK